MLTPSRQYLLAMLLLTIAVGLVEPFLPDPGEQINAIGMMQSFAMAFLLFGWTRAHRRQHQVNNAPAAALLIAFIPPVGIPYYAFTAYGFKRGSSLVLKAIGFFILLTVCYYLIFTLSTHWIYPYFSVSSAS